MAPRLRQFTADLIERLQALHQDVQTTTVYLLGSQAHPIDAISQVNDTQISMQFTASLPGWATEARARLEVSFNLEKSKKFYERADKTFHLVKVVKTFIAEVHAGDARFTEDRERDRKAKLAADAFQGLANALGLTVDPFKPLALKQDNFRYASLPGTPSKVAVVALVTHEQAIEMTQRYRHRRAARGSKPQE